MGRKSSRSHEPPSWVEGLAVAVRTRRKALQLTQRQLAELAGVGPDFVYDLERGKPTLRLGTVLQVLETLGLRLRLEARSGGAAGAPGDWSPWPLEDR